MRCGKKWFEDNGEEEPVAVEAEHGAPSQVEGVSGMAERDLEVEPRPNFGEDLA